MLYECIACVPPHTYNADGESYDADKTVENDESAELEEDEDDCFDFEALMGTRPPLPFVESLSDEYNTLIEIFYVCTNEAPEDRPTADCLVGVLKKS